MREVDALHKVVQDIADKEGRLDGLIAAAGIQQETPALEYKAEDANRMFEVNITGVFMTAQAVAKQMIRFGNGGSMVLIASMSGSVANRVCFLSYWSMSTMLIRITGSHLLSVQRFESGCHSTRSQSCVGMGSA